MEKRVTGIGGIFFKSKNPARLKAWYAKHMGIDSDQYGSKFVWNAIDDEKEQAEMKTTVWSPMPEDTTYYDPGQQGHMINYRVENLEELLRVLKSEEWNMSGRWRSLNMENLHGYSILMG